MSAALCSLFVVLPFVFACAPRPATLEPSTPPPAAAVPDGVTSALPMPAAVAEPEPVGPVDCGGAFGMARLDRDQLEARRGIGVTRFSEVATTKEQPVEVCGVEGELRWLTTRQCDDGSNPFPTPDAAHAAREGSVGKGGRCGKVIDLYAVPCPEASYAVYVDLYMCGPESSAGG